ncbi:MAG: hypothetical protein IJU68_03830 [Bacteroidales bacterium]|nr:hypothetical protein [Bacteroidales bacterium]
MKSRILLFTVLALSLASCSSKKNLNQDYALEEKEFFRLFYTIGGEQKEYRLLQTVGSNNSFSGPGFALAEYDEGILARFSLEWNNNLSAGLVSSHPYFVDNYEYKIKPGCLLKIHGWTFESGTFSFILDRLYNSAMPYDYCNSFDLLFEGIARNDKGETVQIKDGRLVFMKNVVTTMDARDFSLFIYGYQW